MTTATPPSSLARWTALTAAGPEAVRLILALQGVMTVGLGLGLLWAQALGDLALPFEALSVLGVLFGLGTGLAALVLARRTPDAEAMGLLTILLASQLLLVTGVLYSTGGASSPFGSLYLIPLALGALVLPWPRAATLTALTLAAYALLFRFYLPLEAQGMMAHGPDHGEGGAHPGPDGFALHVLGMGLNFFLSAIVIVTLLARLASLARAQGARLATLEAQALRDAHVVALGGVAASAAHALSTPLSTAAITLEQIAEDLPLSDGRRTQVEETLKQITLGRSRLTEALRGAQLDRLETTASARPLLPRLEGVLEGWRLLHPDLILSASVKLEDGAALLDPAFEDTVTTLLNNAAEANLQAHAQTLHLEAETANGWLRLSVEDEGGTPVTPLPPGPVSSKKPYGAGAGLLLAQANLERLGGQLTITEGRAGWRATLTLPLVAAHG